MKRINALTIAGTDPSGGAGIQADLKTFSALGAYGCSVITALVAQNTRGVQSVYRIEPDFVAAQLDSVFSDVRIDTTKIGMLAETDIVEAVAERWREAMHVNAHVAGRRHDARRDRDEAPRLVRPCHRRPRSLVHAVDGHGDQQRLVGIRRAPADEHLDGARLGG